MARRRRVPTLGPRQLNLAEPGPRVKRRVKRQSMAQARREFAPQLAATRGQISAANKAYQQEVQSAVGATSLAQAYLAKAPRYARKQGLRGREMKLLKRDMALQRQQLPQSIPFLTADAASERAEAVRDVRTERAGIRADMATQAASDYGTELGSLRDKASTALKASKEDKAEKVNTKGLSAEEREGTRNAIHEAKRLLTVYAGQEPSNKKEWAAFQGEIGKAEGITPEDARRALRIMFQRRAKAKKRRTAQARQSLNRDLMDPGIRQLLGG